MDNIKITIETNAEQASKSFEDLAKSFSDTDKQAVDLRKEIRGLKDELYKLEPGTEEYGRTLQKLGGKMDQLAETQQQLRAATGGLDTVFQTSTQALGSLAAGFTAVTGVISLFGGNAENLQKAFVKLQAVMAITQGLQGFAGFIKTTKKAIISIQTYTKGLALAKTAVMQQTTATDAMTTAEVGATTATNGLAAAFNKLRIAISKSGVGLAVVALAALATIIMDVNRREEKRLDAMDKLNKATDEAKEETSEYIQTLREYEQTLEESGVIESERKQALIEKTEEQIEAKKEEIKAIEEEMRVQRMLRSQTSDYVSSLGGEFEEYQNLVDIENENNAEMIESEANIKKNEAAIKQLGSELQSLYVKLGQSKISEALSGLSDEFKVKIAGGLADQGDYLRAQIKVYQDAKNELYEIVGGGGTHPSRKIKGATEEERNANKSLSTSFAAALAGLQVELDAYNAGIAKKNRDAAQQLADQLKSNYDDLIKDVTDEAKTIKEKWNSVLNSLDLEGFTIFPKEERSGRMSAQVLRFTNDIDSYLDTWRKLAQKAYDEGKISKKQFDSFISSVNGIKEDLVKELDIKFDTDSISEPVRQFGENLQKSISEFKLDNEKMREALSTGLISQEEYRSWIALKFKEYQEITAQEIETSNPIEQAFITASKQILPPEVKTQIENDVKAYYDEIVKQIDKAYDILEDEYNNEIIGSRKMLENKWEDKMRSWLEGGANTSYWGDSAGTTLSKMQQQAEELYNSLHEEYTREMQLLQEKMSLLDENSEAYANYFKKLDELRQADADAQAAYDAATIANTRQYNQDVLQLHVELADSLSGLAGAMGSYYAEQKEWARDTYGENSKEYEKYLKREGAMKIAQVWTDAAAGIMTAWATSEQLGPIAGPIMAAIQTAALTATATASTLQIKRQTKTNASGGEANVTGITDRVIFGQEQNADQRAQLNAEYNQGATRVFVVESDINNAQGKTRTAVLNNKF
jgi:hypothetical protein